MIAAVVMITTLFGAKVMRHLGQTGRSHFSIEELKDVFDITSFQMVKEFAKAEREIEETKKKDMIDTVTKDAIVSLFDGITKPSKN